MSSKTTQPDPGLGCVNTRWLTSLTEWVAAQGKRQGGVTVAKFHSITNPTLKGSRSPRNFLQAKQAKLLTALVRARWRARSA